MSNVSTCLWYGKDAESAVRLYVSLIPSSSLKHIQRAPANWPGGEAGDVILVNFTLGGQSFQASNGGAPANYGTAASISVECADQAEVDPAVDGAHRRWRLGNYVRLAARQVGRAMANRARGSSASPGGP